MKKLKLLSILLLVVTMFSVVGCSNNGYSYWQIEPFEYSNGKSKEFFVQLSFDATNPYEVWVNVDSVEKSDAKISMAAGYSQTSMRYKTSNVILTNELLSQAGGWVKLNEGISNSYEMVDIATSDKMHINEVIVCDSDGNKFELTLTCAGERIKRDDNNGNVTYYKPDDSSNSAAAEFFKKKNSALNVIDEQDKFNRQDVAFVKIPTSSSSTSSKTTSTTSSK